MKTIPKPQDMFLRVRVSPQVAYELRVEASKRSISRHQLHRAILRSWLALQSKTKETKPRA